MLAIFGPLLTPYDYEDYAGAPYLTPSPAHWFGTTIMGKDVFTQTVYGLRSTLLVGFIAGTIATLLVVSWAFSPVSTAEPFLMNC